MLLDTKGHQKIPNLAKICSILVLIKAVSIGCSLQSVLGICQVALFKVSNLCVPQREEVYQVTKVSTYCT